MPIVRPLPFALIIMDGWGLRREAENNATRQCNPRHLDELAARFPTVSIDTSGPSVGLPEGFIGNSEVGHQCMGAGRVTRQGLSQIFHAIDTGEFYRNEVLLHAFQAAAEAGGAVHLFGLLSDGGVHSHLDHLKALVRMGKQVGCKKLFVHAFTDGRDTRPDSGLHFLTDLEGFLRHEGLGRVASVGGRYYVMDRDRRWERVEKAYRALIRGEGKRAASGVEAVKASYAEGVTDEFIVPTVVEERGRPVATVSDGDSVIFFNFRADRARQITRALTEKGFAEFPVEDRPALADYVCFMKYDEAFDLPVAFEKVRPDRILGEVLAENGIRQVRCAETEKYAHVTFFFNGGREETFTGEERILVPSPKVATYDLQPEMSAPEVAERAIQVVRNIDNLVLVLNFANADMVGHTGNLDAAVEACRMVDNCVGRVVREIFARNGAALVTADHGNAETMIDPATGRPHTAHTLNPVQAILAGEVFRGRRVLQRGTLSDFAPTLLQALELPVPEPMTGRSLLL
jgi:2,3-bisphosphoglycerate-independent phosphoglycerate mutase